VTATDVGIGTDSGNVVNGKEHYTYTRETTYTIMTTYPAPIPSVTSCDGAMEGLRAHAYLLASVSVCHKRKR